ncbi:hypothetical protein ACQEXU_00235 [Vibrio sp. TRT 21S02]|uniref:hypothetical protein n=1 Tax=Vibrio sp. TRT 21S02 TaxID=3418507 RepID=UPI003CF80A10|nr:hypothetical protein [Vibrio parahaemolyticus]
MKNSKAKRMIVTAINTNYGFDYATWEGKELMQTNWHKRVSQGVFRWFGKLKK